MREQGLSLQLMMPNEQQFSGIYLMEEAVWTSNFNQMYLLGNYDKEVFEEVFHAFPIARLYRLKDLEPLEWILRTIDSFTRIEDQLKLCKFWSNSLFNSEKNNEKI